MYLDLSIGRDHSQNQVVSSSPLKSNDDVSNCISVETA